MSTNRQHIGLESESDENDHSNLFLFKQWCVIDGISVDKLSPFVIGKALKAQIGTLKAVKRIQRGAILNRMFQNVCI